MTCGVSQKDMFIDNRTEETSEQEKRIEVGRHMSTLNWASCRIICIFYKREGSMRIGALCRRQCSMGGDAFNACIVLRSIMGPTNEALLVHK